MKKPLWQPSDERIKSAVMTRFIKYVGGGHHTALSGYFDLYDWSIDHIPEFRADVWAFVDIIASKTYDKVVEDLTRFPGTEWFPGAELNFAENPLRYRDERRAFVFKAG